jgi:carbonic anhydrase
MHAPHAVAAPSKTEPRRTQPTLLDVLRSIFLSERFRHTECAYYNTPMQEIIAGVRTFQREVYPRYRELFEELAAGQSPVALVITCSDSRVDPFLFTNAEPGRLFVLRNAGNLVPKYDGVVGGVTATIEFAVVGLKVPNIIVCGHSGCGAIHGLLHPESLKNMPHVANWLEHHADAVREMMDRTGHLGAADEMQHAVDANVLVQLDHLRAQPSVAEALAANRITLHGWVYDIASGSVRAYDEKSQQFAAL